jgi:hypothetical protein
VLLYDLRKNDKPFDRIIAAHAKSAVNSIQFQHAVATAPTALQLRGTAAATSAAATPTKAKQVPTHSHHTQSSSSSAALEMKRTLHLEQQQQQQQLHASQAVPPAFQPSVVLSPNRNLERVKPAKSQPFLGNNNSSNSHSSSSTEQKHQQQQQPRATAKTTTTPTTLQEKIEAAAITRSLVTHDAGAHADPALIATVKQAVRDVLHDSIGALRDELRTDISNLHLDVLRQFHAQHEEFSAKMERVAAQLDSLIARAGGGSM